MLVNPWVIEHAQLNLMGESNTNINMSLGAHVCHPPPPHYIIMYLYSTNFWQAYSLSLHAADVHIKWKPLQVAAPAAPLVVFGKYSRMNVFCLS